MRTRVPISPWRERGEPPPYDHEVLCTSPHVDRRTGRHYQWTLGCDDEADAVQTAADVRARNPAIRTEIRRSRKKSRPGARKN